MPRPARRTARPAAHLAAVAGFGVVLGTAVSALVPTSMTTAPNGQLEALGQPKITSYPGEDRVAGGPDSYPVTYSPQWLAVSEQAERQRMAKWAMPRELPPVGYDQPGPERDLAAQHEGRELEQVAVDEPAGPAADLAEAEQPQT
ncbi:MAG: hypothetical protein ACKOOL_07285 [Novosphingobium sp.]